MDWIESAAAIGGLTVLYLLKRAVELGLDWIRARWTHHHNMAESAQSAALATARQLLAERRVVYDRFRSSVHTLLDAIDGGVYPMGLLYEVRDYWGELRRTAPGSVVSASTAVIDALKPMIDRGPTDDGFIRLTRAIQSFDDSCRADRGLDPAPEATAEAGWRPRRRVNRPATTSSPGRQYFSVEAPPASEVLDQSDEEAALTREFVGLNVQVAPLPPRELSPRR